VVHVAVCVSSHTAEVSLGSDAGNAGMMAATGTDVAAESSPRSFSEIPSLFHIFPYFSTISRFRRLFLSFVDFVSNMVPICSFHFPEMSPRRATGATGGHMVGRMRFVRGTPCPTDPAADFGVGKRSQQGVRDAQRTRLNLQTQRKPIYCIYHIYIYIYNIYIYIVNQPHVRHALALL